MMDLLSSSVRLGVGRPTISCEKKMKRATARCKKKTEIHDKEATCCEKRERLRPHAAMHDEC